MYYQVCIHYHIIVTNLLFKHWIDTICHIVNPVKLIAKVLDYDRENKYASNQSALTYLEGGLLIRLDLGKNKYGRSFSKDPL